MYFKVTESHTYPAVCPVSSEDLRSVRDSGSDDGHPGRSVLSYGVSGACTLEFVSCNYLRTTHYVVGFFCY